jgi:hypothetical protein
MRPSAGNPEGELRSLTCPGMETLQTPLGLVVAVLALIVLFKVAKLALKLLMVAVVIGGLYLAFVA